MLDDPRFGKKETLDLAAMGGKPCWVVLKEPRQTEGLLGSGNMVRAIKMSPDDLAGFVRCMEQRPGSSAAAQEVRVP